MTVPSTPAVATYRLLPGAAAADVVAETSSANNRVAAPASTVVLPDLTVTSVGDSPSHAAPGGTFSVSDTTQNILSAGALSTGSRTVTVPSSANSFR